MLAKKQSIKLTKIQKALVLIFSLIATVLGFILLFLLIFQIINWTWINGFILGIIASGLGLILIYKSWQVLLVTENHYLYVLLLIIRLGIYLVPFLLAFFVLDGEVFSYLGIMIGFIPLCIFPWITALAKLA